MKSNYNSHSPQAPPERKISRRVDSKSDSKRENKGGGVDANGYPMQAQQPQQLAPEVGSPPLLRRAAEPKPLPFSPAQLGPENPTRDIDETWMGCWDEEVSAIYYYNKLTGEATWVNPIE